MRNFVSANEAAANAAKPTILLVEDEVLVRVTIADDLRAEEFVVVEAANGDEAISILRSNPPPDVVVTDMTMPGAIDGAALVEFAHREFPRLHLVMISAREPTGALVDKLDGYLVKPFFPSVLIAYLEKLLSTSNLPQQSSEH